MIRPVAYGSSMTGDISSFGRQLAEREKSVSYTVDDGFNPHDDAFFRVLHQIEPPEVLNIADRIIQYHTNYDLILAWNERVLRACSNATFFPEAVCSWIGRKFEGVPVYPNVDTASKEFAVSFLTSNKTFCPGHKLRVGIYHALPEIIGQARIVKHMSPPRWPDKRTIIEPYQFHIAVENAMHNNWFADKIVDCFVAKTIPLYWGCPNLGEHFNMDGVIRFNDYVELEARIRELTPETYLSKLAAVEENYKRALPYLHTWNRIEDAITEGLAKKSNGVEKSDRVILPTPRVIRIKRPL